jgi:hypothetical protein
MNLESFQTPQRRVWQWLKDQIQEVPESVALCEYACRKSCTQQEWATCERRIQDAARRTAARAQLRAFAAKPPHAQPSQTAPKPPETEEYLIQ